MSPLSSESKYNGRQGSFIVVREIMESGRNELNYSRLLVYLTMLCQLHFLVLKVCC
jgi:hypothetical protein